MNIINFIYSAARLYGPRFCPLKIDHISGLTMYSARAQDDPQEMERN